MRKRWFLPIALAGLCVVLLLPWWRNHHYLRDLYDYGLVVAANGQIARGERPYVDFTTPIQAGFLALNCSIEKLGGGTYGGLTLGGAGLIVASGFGLTFILLRRWPWWLALMAGGAITAASASQHTILWHNTLGVFCLAMVSWAAACAPVWRRESWGWHSLVAVGLLLGGVNKINFHLIALAAALAWALRAGLTGRASWRRVGTTLGALVVLGVVFPLAAELIWTGASPSLWYANVIGLAGGSRLAELSEVFSRKFLFEPPHDYYGPLLLPQAGLFGGLLALLALTFGRPERDRKGPDCWMQPLAVILAAIAGAALLVTNNEIAYVGLAAWLSLTVSVWLGFSGHTLPRRRLTAGVLAPALVLGATSWLSAWQGQRSQFGYLDDPRSTYLAADSAGPQFKALAGLWMPSEFVLSLRKILHNLPVADADGRRPVFYGMGLEFLERFFPARRKFCQPLWVHWKTSYSQAQEDHLEAQLRGEDALDDVLCTIPRNSWPVAIERELARHYHREHLGPWFFRWHWLGADPVDLSDSFASLQQLGGNVDSRMLHMDTWRLTGCRLPNGHKALGTTRESGRVLLRPPCHWLSGEIVLKREANAGTGPLTAKARVIVHGAVPEDVRWSQSIVLPANQEAIAVAFHAEASLERRLMVCLDQSPAQAGKLLMAVRDLQILHAVDWPDQAPQLSNVVAAEVPVTPRLTDSLLGAVAWRPDRLVIRDGRAGEHGLVMQPRSEVWLHTSNMTGNIRGALVALGGGGPRLVRVVWYKGGRLEMLQYAWVSPGQPAAFHAWTAEPGGWFGLLCGDQAGTVAARLTFVDIKP